jgi:hypothetical protein
MYTKAISKILMIILCLSIASAVRINEVELNPTGTDNGNEWIELYSQQNAEINNWTIMNVKGKNFTLEGTFSGYLTLNTPHAFLANDKQKLILINQDKQRIDETPEISDNYNDPRSWQYCSEWILAESSKGEENNCAEENVIDSSGGSSIVQSENNEVNNEKPVENNPIIEDKDNKDEPVQITSETIKLVPKDIKSFKSKTERIKEYSILGFTLFCLVIFVLLAIKYRKIKKEII